MNFRRSHLVAAVLVTLATAGGAFKWSSNHRAARSPASPTDAAAAAPAQPALLAAPLPARRWVVGESFLYSFESDSTGSVTTDKGAQKMDTKLTAKLALTVVSQDANGVRIRGELRAPKFESNVDLGADIQQKLSQPFYFTARRTGELSSFLFAPAAQGAGSMIEIWVRSLQVAMPSTQLALWVQPEEDVLGEYVAAYRVADGTITKQKQNYLRARGLKGLTPMPAESAYDVKSTTEVALDASGWPKTLFETETLKTSINGTELKSAKRTRATLESIEQVAAVLPDSSYVAATVSFEQAKLQSDKNLVAGRSFVQIQVGLMSADQSERSAAQAAMRALFKTDARTIAAAKQEILTGKSDLEAKKRLTAALGAAGTPEAQGALSSILGAKEASVGTKVDATIALGLTQHPTPESAAAVRTAMSSPEPGVSRTAALAAGTMVNSMNAQGSGDSQSMMDKLLDGLTHASTDDERALYLRALGNTGDARALGAIRPYLANPNVELRAVATSALRFIPGEEQDASINAAMKDPEISVRAAAVQAIRFRALAPFTNTVVTALEKDIESIRIQVVTMLIAKRTEDPTLVESLLENASKNDPSESVRKLAGDALTQPA